MLNLLTSQQVKEADKYTIAARSIASADLMEAAAASFVTVFTEEYPDKNKSVSIYCGTGNNGGDGLAIARLLKGQGYQVAVKIVRFNTKTTSDFDINLQRLGQAGISSSDIMAAEALNEDACIIIDALLGSGLNKPLAGEWAALVNYLNSLGRKVVAVDVPSGFPAEGPIGAVSEMIYADLVISFQRPKINFFLPESERSVKRFKVAGIGLDEGFIQSCKTPYYLLTSADICRQLKPRKSFSHKGTYGHALIIAGTDETMGAALLCAEACLNSGAGLTTACIPFAGLTALNVRIPEVMAVPRENGRSPEPDWNKYSAVAIGPGLNTTEQSKAIMQDALKNFRGPFVFDADAINLLALHSTLPGHVPEGSILTPHVKEFDRLFGEHSSWWGRLQTGLKYAEQLGSVIVLKNRFTFIFTPDGQCLINPTGCPAMATGGSGDVLTGMIASFLAQGYGAENAAMLGVYIHGFCGELAAERSAVALPRKVIELIPETIRRFTPPA